MSGVFVVDAMTEADLDEVAAIERVSHARPKGRGSFESDLGNPVARCWVLREGRGAGRGAEAVVGYLVVWVTDVVEVIDVAIAPDKRGRRLVDRLTRLEPDPRGALAEAFSLGERVLLEVRGSNISAIKVYERQGFVRVGVRRGYYGDGEDAVLMARDGVYAAGPSEARRAWRSGAALVRGLYPILSDDVLDVGAFAAAAAVVAPRVSVMQLRFKDSPDAVALKVAREVIEALT
ncbi:MAG TPA: GNAT family N-acetyltransferase, partial [Myxococcota bacterium]|nr:GNAT family N-acetyltransferase [Myxococcota bacterium]